MFKNVFYQEANKSNFADPLCYARHKNYTFLQILKISFHCHFIL